MKKLSLLAGCAAILLSINVSAIQEVTSDAALTSIITNNAQVVVDIYGSSCSPCRFLAPHLESMAGRYPKVKFVKAEMRKVSTFCSNNSIQSVPSVFFFENGIKIGQVVGNVPVQIEAKIKQYFVK